MGMFDKLLASKKPLFLSSLTNEWRAHLHAKESIDVDAETNEAWQRIIDTGAESVFKSFTVTKDDIRKVIQALKDEKAALT
jgi:hypothetical protein